MLPVIAIVGRPNVGKSTLFNRLTRSRNALVADFPGLTRDRLYGTGVYHERHFIVIDTGGIGMPETDMEQLMLSQARQAISEANAILFIVDGKAGYTPADVTIANELRKIEKPIYLVVNKTDGMDKQIAAADFYALGFKELAPISATQGEGVDALIGHVLTGIEETETAATEMYQGIKVAIIGRPNVGKSTLVNRMLGEERVIVFDQPGTTRDSIYIPFERFDQNYVLIDTAGVRRRGKVFEAIEKFSIVKTLQAIADAEVVIFVIDAQENIVEQDQHLLGYIVEAGKALVIAVNKWDNLEDNQRQTIKRELGRRLSFVDFAKNYYISALHGTNVGHLFEAIIVAYRSAFVAVSTRKTTEILQKAITDHQPPLVHGRRIKLRYAHLGGHNPPTFIIHGNQTEAIPSVYRRYLMNFFRKKLALIGTPVRLEFKSSSNPFKDRKNILTPKQVKKRQRLWKR
jgi:GTP-binding protein